LLRWSWRGEKIDRLEVEDVVSTIPITDLVLMISPQAPSKVLEAVEKLQFRDFIVVALFFDQEKITRCSWVYTQDASVRFVRLHEPKNWSKKTCPEGKTSLVLEYPCWEGDEIWKLSDEALIQMGIREVSEELGLVSSRKTLSGMVVRVKKAYPIYGVGYRKYLDVVKKFLSQFSNLHCIGRSGAFVYGNMAYPVRSGLKVSRKIMSERL